MRNCCLFLVFSFSSFLSEAQDSLLSAIDFSAYMEVYAGWSELGGKRHSQPDFLYNNTRTEELSINLAVVRMNWNNSRFSMTLAGQAGSYVQRNLAGENPSLRWINEAHIGMVLGKSGRTKLDVGVLPSHIGMEGLYAHSNPMLTRSLMAENSPYFETGIRVTHISENKKWEVSGLVLNGWQRIYMPDGYYLPAIGTQALFRPNEKWTINWSTYAGDVSFDEDVALRYFQDLWMQFQPNQHWVISAAFDLGSQPDLSNDDWNRSQWLAWQTVLQYRWNNHWGVGMRMEQLRDRDKIYMANPYDGSFDVMGYAMGFEYRPSDKWCVRMEARRLDSPFYIGEERTGDWTNVGQGILVALSGSI